MILSYTKLEELFNSNFGQDYHAIGYMKIAAEAQAKATTNALLDWVEETCSCHPDEYTTLKKGACSKCRHKLRLENEK